MSEVREALQEYLAMRRALGFKLQRDAYLLPRFITYLEESEASTITTQLAVAWATQPADADPRWWSMRLAVVRTFARHLQAFDPRCEVPPPNVLPGRKRRTPPYLYSQADVVGLMEAARGLHPPLRAATHETLIGLLAVTGMRIGEAIRLDRDDIDWANGVLVVRDTKFGKFREVALHPSTVVALADYSRLRDRLCHSTMSSFLVSTEGDRLIYDNNVHSTFHDLVRRAGLRPRSDRCRPRPHDLRHTFAVQTLLGWYRAGVDVEPRLPLLSTYLGHFDPRSTYWYLSASPELMALAGERLERALGERP